MRNLSTGSNVYLPPSRNLTPDISVREIHEHIHRCRYELSLFKHSLWPRLCFHFLQLSGQAPVLFPLSWFPKSREHRLPVRLMRRWVIKPLADACLESCEFLLALFARIWQRLTSSCSCGDPNKVSRTDAARGPRRL